MTLFSWLSRGNPEIGHDSFGEEQGPPVNWDNEDNMIDFDFGIPPRPEAEPPAPEPSAPEPRMSVPPAPEARISASPGPENHGFAPLDLEALASEALALEPLVAEQLSSPESEPPAPPPVHIVDIAVELFKMSPERATEYLVVEDLDDYEGDEATYGGFDASRKRKLDHDDEYEDEAEVDGYLSSESLDQHMSSGEGPSARASGRTSGRTTRQTSHNARMDNDDSDEIILDRPRRKTRNLRPRYENTQTAANTSQFGRSDDVDELAQEPEEIGSDGDFFLVQSDLQPRRQMKRRKRSSRMLTLKGKGVKDGIDFEAPRRSGRANKATGSMYEQYDGDDDNFFVEDDKAPGAPKVIAVKEIFQPLTAEEEGFRDVHNEECSTCDSRNPDKGIPIYCQGCSYSYHKVCIGQRAARDHLVTKIGHESFVLQCRYCINLPQKKDKRAPDLTRCFTCREPGKSCKPFSQRKTAKQEEQLRLENEGEDPVHKVDRKLINNAETSLFRCSTCHRGFHWEHLPNTPADDSTRITSDLDSLRAKNIEEYSIEWKCKDCTDAPGKIDALVAWRPVDRDNYIGQSYLDYGEDNIEYLVKWEKQSHRHCVWMPGSWVWGATHGTMRSAYAKRVAAEEIGPQFDEKDAIPEELTMIDVILSVQYKPGFRPTSLKADFQNLKKIDKVYVKFLGLGYDKVVWDDPPPADSGQLYDEFLSAYEEYLAGVYFEDISRSVMLERIKEFRALDFAGEIETTDQPKTIRNGELMKYQISGVNWLKYNYHKQHNAVLADEMGLGKTVQIVALLADLVKQAPRVWPFLVVVPNSTVPNWRREIKKWAPDLRVVTYHGGKQAQDLAFRFELFPRGTATIKAHIVVMSYEAAQDPATKTRFNSVHFAGLIVDEGHRLKNDENLLYAALTAMKIPYRVLLTGTPLQNNKRELFNLLQFLNPKLDAATLDDEYGELTAENIPKLHDTIRPYFLRRTKADTLKFLPKMARVIIPVTMTVLQEKLSKSIIAKNSQLIHAIMAKGKLKATEKGSLNNILMQLRKCLCHPFMYSTAVEDRVDDPVKMHNNLVDASAKLLLLNIMLPKLKEQGHRILLFSQFLDQLNILEDFLTGIGLTYSRIDGNMSSLEKQKRIDAYNAPDSPIFAMLLSTRAGGVGINLATADTVMILDPDFNPHQDLQAVSRCHRIGQRKPVLCFQLTTKDSVEEKILQAGRKKMALDHALIETMDDNKKEDIPDLESILKHGAEALFGDAKRETIVYDSASVDKLLDRHRLIAEQNPEEGEEGQTLNDAFSFARVWNNGAGDVVTEDLGAEVVEPVINQSVWEEILRKREEEARLEAEANKETFGRGARRRGKAIQYSTRRGDEEGQEDGAPGDEDMSGYDDDFVGSGAESDGDDSDEAPQTVTPPGELSEKDMRGKKKTKGIASQGTTPARTSLKTPKQTPTPKKAAVPKTPSTKNAAGAGPKTPARKTAVVKAPATKKISTPVPKKSAKAPKETSAPKKSETPKQSSTGKKSSVGKQSSSSKQPSSSQPTTKYADLKRAVKSKKAAKSKTEDGTVMKSAPIDTNKLQTPSRPNRSSPSPSPSEPMATSPSANTVEQKGLMKEPRPASLPSRPPRSINPAFLTVPPPATSLPPGPPSLPPKPPTPLEQQHSKYTFPAGVQPDMNLNNHDSNKFLPNNNNNLPDNSFLPSNTFIPPNNSFLSNSNFSVANNNFPTVNAPNFSSAGMPSYQVSSEPSFATTSISIPTGFLPNMQQPYVWQMAPQVPSPLSALPGMQANLTLPSMGQGRGQGQGMGPVQGYLGYATPVGYPTPAPEEGHNLQWGKQQEEELQDQEYQPWEPSP